jgi:hypothetical protein
VKREHDEPADDPADDDGIRSILPKSLIDGIGTMLDRGMDCQELADRLGQLIDVMAEDICRTAIKPKKYCMKK